MKRCLDLVYRIGMYNIYYIIFYWKKGNGKRKRKWWVRLKTNGAAGNKVGPWAHSYMNIKMDIYGLKFFLTNSVLLVG